MLMMLPFEAPTIFEGIHKSYFRMPRVVKDQRSKFENDDLFRQLSHESAVKYTGFKDRPLEERQMKFISNCQEGHTEVSVVQSGNQFTLMFNPTANPAYNNEGCDFDKELGKVHIKSGFILNGVCVLWRGWLDLQRLEGFGCLEFDEYRAYLEEAMLKQQIDKQQQQSACNTSQLQLQQQQATSNHLNHQPSPLGRLNAHPPIAAPQPQQQQQPPPQHHPLAHLPPVGQSALQPPVSLADSYGNAAIAAAAAAAFHQALGVQPPASYAPPALLPVAGAAHLPPAAYLNGAPATTTAAPPLGIQARVSPPTSNHHQPQQPHQIRPLSNGTSNASGNSPEHQQQYQPQQRQSLKRSLEPPDQTQLDEVDVVSDIHAHDLDFPPRRIFKSAPITSNHHAHHHHQPLTTATHRATRRA